MRKLLCLLLALLLTGCLSALAEDAPARRAVQYPGLDISIAVPAQCKSFYRDNIGLSVNFNEENEDGYCRVRVLSVGADFSEKAYLEKDLEDELAFWYTGRNYNYLDQVDPVQPYTVAGREMTGRLYHASLVSPKTGWVLLDRWNGMVIRYDALFSPDHPDAVLTLLSNLVRSVTNPTLAPKATAQRGQAIDCAEQRFSFSADPAYPWKYAAGEGVTVYTQSQGSIPYVMVYQSEDLVVEAYEYLQEQYTPHMQEQYGDKLKYHYEYQDFQIGGKSLPVGWYEYMVGEHRVIMLRCLDSTGPRTVAFTAKYIQGAGDKTMLALDAAIRTFHSTAEPLR